MKIFEPLIGSSITTAATGAVLMARTTGEPVCVNFNEIEIVARPETEPETLVNEYHRQSEARAKVYRESPEGIAAAERLRQRQEEESKRRVAFNALDVSLSVRPGKEQEYADYKAMNSKDGYSLGVVTFGERWAYLMEQAMRDGQKLGDVASQLSHEADTDGLTGFMYGCAVQALAHFWIHGEELRRWHNLDTQIQDEGERANETGGTLNPALLSMDISKA